MTFTQTVKGIFVKPKKDAVDNSQSGKGKKFLSRISGAFMLPISVMAIAGLFLGIGSALESNLTTEAGKTFGLFMKNLGQPVFDAMPALFLMAIVISFTDDIGTAVFAGLIGYLIFLSLQTPFIHSSSNAADIAAAKATIGAHAQITGNSGYTTAAFVGGSLTGDALKDAQAAFNDAQAFLKTNPIDSDSVGHASILFGMGDALEAKLYKVVGSTWGISSMTTSVFGGIIVGFIVAWAYNNFHKVELPSIISFFGGKRFVAFVVIVMMIPLTFLFLLVWPWIAIGLAYFGEYSGKVAGLDSFLFGFGERALVPFGLHHVFYAPLWFTGAGGDASQPIQDFLATNTFVGAGADSMVHFNAVGDQAMWAKIAGFSFNDVEWVSSKGYTGTVAAAQAAGTYHSLPVYEFFQEKLEMRIGRFMQGKFAFMQMGLPMAGLAMILAAPKENRKTAAAIIIPASVTSFVTGVTEPIEFTFVFLAPALFWGFHALMAATSFLLMNLLGAHMGMTLSGGFIDTIVYGILPMQKGTHFWWAYVIGSGLAPIYFFAFYWYIKRFDLSTPGRGGNTKLFTKQDYKDSKAKASGAGNDPQAMAIIEAYGGKSNITKTANCATRLRFDVKDASIVKEENLKAAGALGVMKTSKTHVQAIMGPSAETMHQKIKDALANMPAETVKKAPAKKVVAKK